MDIMDFEAIDDVLILVGIVLIIFSQPLYGIILVIAGLMMMRIKGEGGRTPKPVDKEDYGRVDTGDDIDTGDDGDADDGGDDGDDGDDGDE
ncbi:MAG TPA: hypothetical protein VJI13_06645 [Candidatus Norongarragalinales archaeon]|nr:hypothetical protein [Candidatus Norongarragalinales archaeon]